MFCTKCGNQMPNDAAFCAACGARLIQPTPSQENDPVKEVQADPAPDQKNDPVKEEQSTPMSSQQEDLPLSEAPAADSGNEDQQQKPKKKKKAALIVSICIVVLLLILVAAALTAYCMFFKNRQPLEAVWAYVDESGTAYICYGNGKKLSINGVEDAFMTPDQKKVVILEKGGDLYWTDVKLSEKHVIMSHSKDMKIGSDDDFLYNDSFFYLVADIPNDSAILYRYHFDNESNIKISSIADENIDDIVASESYKYASSVSLAIARDGWIEVLTADSNEFKKLTKYDQEQNIELLAISPDGNMLIWAIETEELDYTAYYSYKETVTKLKSSVEDADATISADGKLAFAILDQDLFYIRNGEYESVHFSDEINNCYTEDGRSICDDNNTRQDKGCFVSIEKDESSVLYYVDFDDAIKYKLIDAESIYIASESKIVYKTDGGRYMYAEFDRKETALEDEHAITSADNVSFVNLEECSDYIFFRVYDEDYDTSMVDLYYYDIDENRSKKIASKVHTYGKMSIDGTKFFYFEDMNKEDWTGTLMVYDIKKDKSTQLATDVLMTSVTSHFLNGTIDPNSFFYMTGNTEEELDIYYYNGKKSKLLITGFEY